MRILVVYIALAFSTSLDAQITESQLQNLQSFINSEIADQKASGVSITIHTQGDTHTQHFGYSNFELQKPITDDIRLFSASTSKVIAAAAVLKLEFEGKLEVEDPIGKYVNGLHPEIARLRIIDLISHMSGLEDFTVDFGDSGPAKHISFSQKLDDGDFYTKPGEAFSYSNPGYNMLGALIESVTGMGFNDAMKSLIFAPLEMNASTFRADELNRDMIATGYHSRGGDLIAYNRLPDDAEGRVSGFLLTTSQDMTKFLLWLMDAENPIHDKVLQTLVSEEMTGSSWTYGYGLFKWTQCDEEVYWHTGGMPGYRANILFHPVKKYSMVILSNGENLNRSEILKLGLSDILGADCESGSGSEQKLTNFNEAEIENLIGDYRQNIGMRISLFKHNSTFKASVNGQQFDVKKNELGQLVMLQNSEVSRTYGIRFDETGKANYILYWVRSYPRVD